MLVGPLIAVRLSLRQFRSTRWWEKQADTYSNIISHLTTLQYALGLWSDSALRLKTVPSDSVKQAISTKYAEAEEAIKMADGGRAGAAAGGPRSFP